MYPELDFDSVVLVVVVVALIPESVWEDFASGGFVFAAPSSFPAPTR